MNGKKKTITGVLAILLSAAIYIGSCSNPGQKLANNPTEGFKPNEVGLAGVKTAPTKDSETLQEQGNNKEKDKKLITLARGIFKAERTQGTIGKSGNAADNPADNVFKVLVPGMVKNGDRVKIRYQLWGLRDHNSACLGINDNISTGGLVVEPSVGWTSVEEVVDARSLKNGENVFRFSVPEDMDYNYKVKDLEVSVMPSNTLAARSLNVDQPDTRFYYDKYGYVRGFVGGEGSQQATIYIGGKEVSNNNSYFEGLAEKPEGSSEEFSSEVRVVFADGQEINTQVTFNKPAEGEFNLVHNPGYKRVEQEVGRGKALNLTLGKFSVEAGNGFVNQPMTITATTLRGQDMAIISQGMVNVTGEARGFRMLPHHDKFDKAIRISVPYDRGALPTGYQPSDIRTYYYNEDEGRWVALPLEKVDEELSVVVSYTDHFTDFVNGVLKVPEAPQTSANVPTMFSDIKPANPLEGMNIISPPVANNHGTANLSLPIEVPAGRNGMQPNLAISYSSDGGNGWLGEGWSLNLPSIDVETRWGVPRYSTSYETESYLVNGEQVTPTVNMTDFVLRDMTTLQKRFYQKVEGEFKKIIRHGNSPSNYWWEVIDRNGLTYIYGKYSIDPGVNPACVLKSTNNNIGRWMLAEVRDIHGNFVKYKYSIVTTSSLDGIVKNGTEIYPTEITYTGNNTNEGNYKVIFENDALGSRVDKIVSANMGFKEVIANRLVRITVKYKNEFIRQYLIKYKEGSFNKSLICSIYEVNDSSVFTNYNTNLSEFGCNGFDGYKSNIPGVLIHKFEYYHDDASGFLTESTIEIEDEDDDDVDSVFTLGRSRTLGLQVGGQVGFGWDEDFYKKSNSVAIGYNYSRDANRQRKTIMDVNGDGYPDFITERDNELFYKKINYDGCVFTAESGNHKISNGRRLNKSIATTHTFGAELDLSLDTFPILNAAYSHSEPKEYTDCYFADINGDGLVDIINESNVYFNRTIEQEGFFEEEVSDTHFLPGSSCNYIIRSQGINDSLFINREISDLYGRDAVRLWTAPIDGEITIYAPISLIKESSYNRENSKLADGVRYLIQHKNNTTLLVNDTIMASNYLVKNANPINVQVLKGDKIYFRLQANNYRLYDKVEWNPVIFYNQLDTSLKDANGKNLYAYYSSKDFLASDNRGYGAPLSGTINLRGKINAINTLSDSVSIKVLKNGSVQASWDYPDNTAFNLTINTNIIVNEADEIQVVAYSNTQIDLNSIEADLEVEYTNTGNQTNDLDDLIVPVNLIYSYFQNVTQLRDPVFLQAGMHDIKPSINYLPGSWSGNIILSAKKDGELLGKAIYKVVNNKINGDSMFQININAPTNVFFDYFIQSGGLLGKVSSTDVSINDNLGNQSSLYETMNDSMWKFGNLHRGWGYFSYMDKSSSLINESKLYIPRLYENTDLQNFDTTGINSYQSLVDELNSAAGISLQHLPFLPMQPDLDSNVWRDYSKMCNIGIKHTTLYIPEYNPNDTLYDGPTYNSFINGKTIKTIKIENDGKSNSFSIGAGVSIINGSISYTSGENITTTGYMDLNGDRFPDVFGYSSTQYTEPSGNFAKSITSHNLGMGFEKTSYNNIGSSVGMNFNKTITTVVVDNKVVEFTQSGVGVSGSYSHGNNEVDYKFTDINGDGLPDKVMSDGNVRLNMGYYFEPEVNIQIDPLSESKNNMISLNGSFSFLSKFSKWNYSWGAGVGGSYNWSSADYDWIDMNGDGLIDRVKKDGNDLKVCYNNGASLSQEISFAANSTINTNSSISINAGGTFTLGFLILPTFKLYVNPSYSNYININFAKSMLSDFNNDGKADLISSDGSDGIKVKMNAIGKNNLLKVVTTPTNGQYGISYLLLESSVDMPNRKYVMYRLNIVDGYAGDSSYSFNTFYEYKSPKYDRSERQFFGFAEVKSNVKGINAQNNFETLKLRVEKYFNTDFLFAGLKYEESTLDSSGNIYQKTKYIYKRKEISTGNIVHPDSISCFGPYYPAIAEIHNFFYEGQASYSIHTKESFLHGPYGNVKQHINHNDSALTSDDVLTKIFYCPDTISHILSLVDTLMVESGGNIYRYRTAQYDNNGNLTQITSHDGSNKSIVDIEYNSLGQINKIFYPKNAANQRVSYSYMYDNVVGIYQTRVTNHRGEYSTSQYDYRLGLPVASTDIGGNKVEYSYYNDGLLKTIRGPREVQAGLTYLALFEYSRHLVTEPKSLFYSKVSTIDPYVDENRYVSIIHSDAMGRIIQSKKKTTITINGHDSVVYAVSGKQVVDYLGRVISSYHPTFMQLCHDSTLFTGISSLNPSRVTYDILDRQITSMAPDLTVTSFQYGFGNDVAGITRFLQQVTDPMGITVKSFFDPTGKQTTIAAPLSTITSFEYDPLGQLLKSTDPEANETSYEYDGLGRLLKRVHPDAGTTSYTYDLAGNLLSTQTQNLAQVNKHINYTYDYERLTNVSYPENIENDVFYQFYNSGPQTGRLYKVQDASTIQEFEYGSMGEVVKNTRTYIEPDGGTYSFAMTFAYDSYGRLSGMVYPDSEVVTYGYNLTGDLTSMIGEKGGNSYHYLDSIKYDIYGSKVRQYLGNGSSTSFTYDPATRRLDSLLTTDASGNPLMVLTYAYDDASNITAIENSASSVGGMGGNYSYSYTYDSLYRLTNSSGLFDDGNQYPYQLAMKYSKSGNILGKNLEVTTLLNGVQNNVTYNRNNFNYQAHRLIMFNDSLTSTNSSFEYDANGNMTWYSMPTKRLERNLCWDEENRLSSVKDNNYLSSYIYDAGGERVWKLTGNVERMMINGDQYIDMVNLSNKTLYASPFLVVADQAYTKHYYAGSERVASKIGAGLASALVHPTNYQVPPVNSSMELLPKQIWEMVDRQATCTGMGSGYTNIFNGFGSIESATNQPASDPENEIYFYHTDHLGSSSWITDATGSAYQHMQSLPFGEDYIDQRTSSWTAPYRFTGKERDMETGWDYFGARYYDSELSIWLSVDPLASKFPGISGYAYVMNNPVKLFDKFGLEPEERKPIEYEPNKYSRRYNRKYKHWIEKNRDNLVDVPNVEFIDLFLHSKNAFGKEVINSRWYKKYKNHVETSNSTGWRNKITAPEQDNCLNSVSDLSHGNVNTIIDFNANEGSLYISYNMFSVADRIQLYDESNGNIIYDSQYVTGKDSQVVKFQLSSGNTEIRLVINEGKKPSNATAFKYKIGLVNGELKITTSTKIETTKKQQ